MNTTQTGVNEDGSPRYMYSFDQEPDVDGNIGGLLVTGPVSGTVKLTDGAVYNVTSPVIEHAPGHAGPIMHHIEVMHEMSGALGADFKHTCTDACGAEAGDQTETPITTPLANDADTGTVATAVQVAASDAIPPATE